MIPSAYQLKKTLMLPWVWYRRLRERHQTGFIRAALELHYYRPAFYRFVQASVVNPVILHEADLNEHSTVIDIGAFVGDWAAAVMDRYNPTVYAFEPNPQIYQALDRKTGRYPKLIPQPYGLGGHSARLKISLKGLGSSLYDHHTNDADTRWADAEIRDIAQVWRELSLSNVDLVKINIEGAEFELLERMIEADLFSDVRCFMVQFHEWHPRAYSRRRRIRRELRKTHDLDWDHHFVWEKWSRRP